MSRSKKKSPPIRKRRHWLWALLLVPLAVAAGILLLERDLIEWNRGGFPGRPLTVTPEQKLDGTLLRAIRELGVSPAKIRTSRAEDGLDLYRFRCPGRMHPVTANRWLSRIIEDEGLRILDCSEAGRPGRPDIFYLVEQTGDPSLRARLRLDPPRGDPPLFQDQPILVIVIDDFGNNYGPVARGLLELPLPLTVSILPDQRRSERVEKEARKHGHSVFLHLPMEPIDWPASDPGPGAVFAGIGRDSVMTLLDRHSAGFRRLDGLNNHMGSRASQDTEVVNAILDWTAERDLLVLDSWTHHKSKIALLAGAHGRPPLRADLFLDGEGEDESAIADNLLELGEIARERGWAIGIGHPRRETYEILKRMTPRLEDYGFRFLNLSQLAEEVFPDS